MKKFLFSLALVLLCASIPMLFVACETNYAAIAGTYKLASATAQNGTTKTIDQLVTNGQVSNKEQEFITLSKEKGFEVSGLIKTALGENSGKFSVNNNVIILELESGNVLGSLNGKTITLNVNGTTYIFKKA